MIKNKVLTNVIALIFILGFFYSNSFALSWFQKTSIENNKSGTITISYSASNSELKGADFFKSLPFSEEKIKSTYSSDNNKIQNIVLNKKRQDSTFVNVILSFKDINKINTASGFSKVKVTWYKNADSTVFMYKVDQNEEFANNVIASCLFELPTNEIIRSSGIKKGDNAFSLQIKPESFKNGYNVFAVFKNSADNQDNKQTTGKDEKESGKGCGLFGVEMPFIFGMGLLFIRRRLKK